MKKKLRVFAICSLIASLAIFVFSYILFHHMTPEGNFTSTWCDEPGKPLVTVLFAILGVLFLFSGLISTLARFVFFGKSGGDNNEE